MPTNFWVNLNVAGLTRAHMAVTNLCDKQLTGYTFIAYGALGDQPGQHQWHYLAPWQKLPDGTFIAPNKFNFQSSPPLTTERRFTLPANNFGLPDQYAF